MTVARPVIGMIANQAATGTKTPEDTTDPPVATNATNAQGDTTDLQAVIDMIAARAVAATSIKTPEEILGAQAITAKQAAIATIATTASSDRTWFGLDPPA